MTRRILAGVMCAALAVGTTPAFAQQAATAGLISGTATKEAKPPYEQFRVQLRSVADGTVVSTQPLSPTGTFTIPSVPFGPAHLVELVNVSSNSIVCTEGPFTLSASGQTSRVGVQISCNSRASWLLLAAAGLPALVASPRSSTGGGSVTPFGPASADRSSLAEIGRLPQPPDFSWSDVTEYRRGGLWPAPLFAFANPRRICRTQHK